MIFDFQMGTMFSLKSAMNQEYKKYFKQITFLVKPTQSISSATIYKDYKDYNIFFIKNNGQVNGKQEKEQRRFFTKLKFQRNNDQPKRDLGVFGYNRGKLFVSIKKDFTSFIVNSLIISVFLYSVYTLAPKETISQRRKRIIRERLMKEYEITQQDLELVEEFDDVVEK